MTTPPRNLRRSTGAILLGFLAVFVLSLGTDQVFHVLEVFPPWGEPMWETSDNLLALAYRIVFNTFGSFLMAKFAPRHPLRHALIGAAIGFVLSSAGAVGAIQMNLGPAWYPILLALSAWPCAWLGASLHLRLARRS
jgi:hypothetical protein